VSLLVALASIGASTATLSLVSRSRLWLTALLSTAPLLAVLLAAGNPMEWPWDQPSGPHLAPDSGYWIAVGSLVLALMALTLILLGAVRFRRQRPRTASVVTA
jgi:hypothetical protein